ncbi:MAG: nuclear transport factor 2 family protein [Kofleriaceae bacterium]
MKYLALTIALVACGSKKQPDKTKAQDPIDKPRPSDAKQRIERFDACWGKSDATVLATCYADNAIVESPGAGFPPTTSRTAIVEAAIGLEKQFPDLEISPNVVLGNGKQLAAIVKLAGKPMGVVGAVVVDFDDQGTIAHESDFFDSQTIRYQMKPDPAHPVRSPDAMPALAYIRLVNTPDAPADAANAAVVTKFVEAFNHHDLTAAGALLDEHATWSDPTEPKDWTKAELLADRAVGIKAFPDLQISHPTIWAASNYVVEQAELVGTNDGPMPGIAAPTHKKIAIPYVTIYELRAGKILHAYAFLQSSALVTQLGLE